MNAKKSKFAAKTVKAVALRCWWNEPKKQKLGEHFNLTKDQLKELRNSEAYQDAIAHLMLRQRNSSEEFEKWVKVLVKKWGDEMPKRLGRYVGIDDPEVVRDLIKRVRKEIAAGKGKTLQMIPNPSKFDAFQLEKIGRGDEYVYLYYFPTYKLYYEKCLGERRYPCNIGKAKNDVTKRITEQMGQQLPEKIRIALILRTEDCRTLESKIHKELKGRNRWLDPKYNDVIGIEWFLTNRAEVMRIFRKLQGE